MDRLKDAQPDSVSIPVRSDSTYSNPGNSSGGGATDDNDLENFYNSVKDVQGYIRDIQAFAVELQGKHSEKMQTADEKKAAALEDDIQLTTDKITNLTKQAKEKLDALQKGTAKLKETPDMEAANAGVIKIQQNQHAHLLKTFLAAVQDYQKIQNDNQKAYHEQTRRRIQMKYTNADGTTIDDATAERLATEALEQGTENEIFQQSKDELQRIIENRNDIYRIEQSMRELNQLFNDLAMLVNEQQEALDNILTNVQNSVKYVEKGREELQKAKKHAKKSRKKFCWLIVIVFVIFMFVLAAILGATVSF